MDQKKKMTQHDLSYSVRSYTMKKSNYFEEDEVALNQNPKTPSEVEEEEEEFEREMKEWREEIERLAKEGPLEGPPNQHYDH